MINHGNFLEWLQNPFSTHFCPELTLRERVSDDEISKNNLVVIDVSYPDTEKSKTITESEFDEIWANTFTYATKNERDALKKRIFK